MPDFDRGDPASAWQGRRGRALFQHVIEHRFWTTWHCESVGEDHDWSSSGVHVDRARARLADPDRLTIGFAVGECSGSDADTDSSARATSFTGSTSRITGCEQVVRAV